MVSGSLATMLGLSAQTILSVHHASRQVIAPTSQRIVLALELQVFQATLSLALARMLMRLFVGSG